MTFKLCTIWRLDGFGPFQYWKQIKCSNPYNRMEFPLKMFMLITSTLQGSQELGQPTGNSSDNVTTVSILGQQERELQNKIFFESNFPALGIGDLVDGVLRHPHDRLDHLLRDRLLISWRLVPENKSDWIFDDQFGKRNEIQCSLRRLVIKIL